jgi:phosphate-selective porin OprO and OprP
MPGASAACLALLAATSAAAQEPSVRLGLAEIKPYVLLQLDEAGTFGPAQSGGQAAGFNARHGRLGARATLGEAWQFGFIWDFGGTPGNHSRLFEAVAAYSGFKPFTLVSGAFKPAFTLEYAQVAENLLFLERASIVNIVGGLVAGAGRVVFGEVRATGDRWFASTLLTGGQTGPGAQGDQRAWLGRAAGLVVKTDEVALHLGTSAGWVFQPPRTGAGQRVLSFSDQPEFQVDPADASLSTGPLNVASAGFGGVESGLTWGRLWLQAEWYGIDVDRSDGQGGLFFSGWYAQAAYTLLGKPRAWDPKSGAWRRPKPARGFDPARGDWGALEIGARISIADLRSGDVRGGRQSVWTTGLNWFPVEPLRFTVQYEHATVTGAETPRTQNAIALRGQLAF